MLLSNGSVIKSDVIESFNKAIKNDENVENGQIIWDFVDADLIMDLMDTYPTDYLHDCFDKLVDNYLGVKPALEKGYSK